MLFGKRLVLSTGVVILLVTIVGATFSTTSGHDMFANLLGLESSFPASASTAIAPPSRLFAPQGNSCVSAASGSWNSPATWTGCGGGSPASADDAFIQSGHTVTLTGNESVHDLNISTGTTSATTGSEGVVALAANTLSVNGKLRCYFAAVGTTPGTATNTIGPAPITVTANSVGNLKFVGSSRSITVTGEWGATNTGSQTTFPVEIALTAGETATLQASIKAASWTITSGTLDAQNTISADNGFSGQGDIFVAAGATLISNQSGSSNNVFQRGATTKAGALTVNGLLQLTGTSPNIAVNSIDFSGGTVEYSKAGTQTLAVASNSGGAPNVYNNLKLSGTSAKTLSQSTTVNGTLTMAGDATQTLALNTFALTYGASSTLEYAGTAAQTTAATEFPAANGPASLKINNANGVTLAAARSLASSGILTLTNGILATTIPNTLTIANTATTAISGGSTASFVNGPINRTLPPSLSNSSNVYNLPLGSGATYLPVSMTGLTTGATGPVLQLTANAANSGGSADGSTLGNISTTEYWSNKVVSGALNGGRISLTRQAALSGLNAIGRSTSANGTYTSIGGTPSGTSINASSDIGPITAGNSQFYVMGTVATVTAPTVTSVSPNSGPAAGGTSVTITGTGFTGATAVNFGANAITPVVNSDTSITAVSPAASAGTVHITVTTPGGTSAATGGDQFTYVAPATLGAYADAQVNIGGQVVVTPSAGPTGATRVYATPPAGFSGVVTVDPATGAVRVTNAGPKTGTFGITAVNSAGTVSTSFKLTVNTPATSCSGVTFSPATITAGTTPENAAIGDFNGDGVQDIAVANAGSNNVSVEFGTGTGAFGAATNYAVGQGPIWLAVADFNNDGKQDIAAVNETDASVSILLNTGSGAFTAFGSYLTNGLNPLSIASGDLNGDGNADFVIANQGSNNVAVLLGTGNGGFTLRGNFATAAQPISVVLRDFNNDGILDVATANQGSNSVSILPGVGDGSLSATTNLTVGTSPHGIAAGDIDGDGLPDIVTANFSASTVSLLRNTGGGSWAGFASFVTGANPTSLTLADMNNDGNLDIVATASGAGLVDVLLGSGNGSFGAATGYSAPTPYSASIGDLNGDGMLDVVSANNGSGNLTVLTHTCTQPDLTISNVQASVGQTQAGNPVFYTITATNSGTGVANAGVVVRFTLPQGLLFQGGGQASGQHPFTSCAENAGVVTCTTFETFASSHSVDINVVVTPPVGNFTLPANAVVIDPDNTITESNESNNSYGSAVTFTTFDAPAVTTTAPAAVGSTTATLAGSANPNNLDTTGYFRYGTTNPGTCDDTFGTRAPATGGTDLGSGLSSVPYTQSISGLTAGVTYYYCAVATSGAQRTTFGGVQSFTTANLPTVNSSPATGVGLTDATLVGNVTADGGAAITERGFYYKTGTGVTGNTANGEAKVVVSGTTGSFSQAISNLTTGTQYSFKAYATNSVGTQLSPEQTFTTIARLNGTYIVGNGGDFAGLNDAVSAYNTRGLDGPVTFTILNTGGAASFPLTVGTAVGASATNTLTIQPAAGVVAQIVNNTASSNPVLQFDGASYVIFDGTPGAPNSAGFQIQNGSGGSVTGPAIRFVNSANHITINKAIVDSHNANGGGTIEFDAPAAGNSISDNLIENCRIGNSGSNAPFARIYLDAGAGAGTAERNSFTGNTVSEFGNMGVYVGSGYTDTTIRANNISTDLFSPGADLTGIQVSTTTASTTNIVGNTIGPIYGLSQSIPGIGIKYSDGIAGTVVNANNNYINESYNYDFYGIVSAANAGVGNYYFNTIFLTVQSNQISAGLKVFGPHVVNFKDNIVNSFRNDQQKTYAIIDADPATTLNSDYNDLWIAPGATHPFTGSFNGADYATLAAWQTATGLDPHSISASANAGGGHIDVRPCCAASPVARRGTPIAGITTDIDGDIRRTGTSFPNGPDIGADEFTTYVLNYAASSNGSLSGQGLQIVNPGGSGTQVTAVPAAHYHFTLWSPDGDPNPSRTDSPVNADASYTANFAIDQFSVIYDANGGTGTAPTTQTADYGSSVNLANNSFTRTGYNFTGWDTVPSGSGSNHPAGSAFTIPAGNTTMYAQWSAASVATSTAVTTSQSPSVYGAAVTLTATVTVQGVGTPVTVGTVTLYDNAGCSGPVVGSGTPNASGKVTVTTSTLGGGIHTITGCYTGTTLFTDSNGSVGQTVNKVDQTIAFGLIADQAYAPGGHVTFNLPTASSGLQVTLTSETTSVCTLPDPHVGQANFVAIGACTIRASQGGDGNYNAAANVDQTFQINGNAMVSTPDTSALNGHNVTIPVNTSDLTGLGVISAQFTFTFDRTVLSGNPADISVTPGAVLPVDGSNNQLSQLDYNVVDDPDTVNNPNLTHIYVSIYGADPFVGAGPIVNIHMKAAGLYPQTSAETVSDMLFNGGRLTTGVTSGTFSVTKLPQSIVVDTAAPATAEYLSQFGVAAHATSGFAVAVSAAGACSGSGANGSATITMTAATGTCTIRYSQPGDATSYFAATDVTSDTSADRASTVTTVTFEAGPYVYRGTAYTATAAVAGPGLFSQSLTPQYSGDCTNVTSANGCSASASFAGNSNYKPSSDTKSITIVARNLSGQVLYKNAATPSVGIPQVTVAASGTPAVSSSLTDASGNYSLTGFGTGSYDVTLSKPALDCNHHNGIIANDASLISQHVVHLITLTPTQLEAANVSGSPTVTSFDASLIAQYLACMNNPASSAGTWKFDSYSSTVGANDSHNFLGLLLGDVDGDWSASGPQSKPQLAAAALGMDATRASLANLSAMQGSQVTVPMRLDNLKGAGVTAYEFDVEYDPTVLSASKGAASLGGTLSQGLGVVSNSPQPGLLKVVVYGALPKTGDGVYINLNFSAIGESGSVSPLTIKEFTLNDGRTQVVTQNGSITVNAASGPAFSGRVVTSSGAPIRNAWVSFTTTGGQTVSMLSNSFGYVILSGLNPGETYTLTTVARGYTFTPVSLTASAGLTQVEIVAQP